MALVVGCSSATPEEETAGADQTAALTRNFSNHPAILEIDTADHVYAVSDVHGQYEVFVRLLAANKLIAKAEADPKKVKWTGGTATLVIAGDHIDKGPKSIDVIDLLRSLEEQAPRSGGRSIALMGNHEAEFLEDPSNKKAMSTGKDDEGIGPQLEELGIDAEKMAAGKDKEGRGKWLANLPLGVRVKKWFFAHGGNTQRMSIKDLNKKLQNSIANNGFGDKDITGKDSILQAQQWYGNPKDANAGAKEVEALGGVKHIVFGHDPGAFDSRGKPRQSKNGLLVKIDGAMGLHDKQSPNPGFMLHVSTKGEDSAEVLDEKGKDSPLE
jgi:hypothetical protein